MSGAPWTPELGRLVVRRVEYRGVPSDEVELLFAFTGNYGSTLYQTIARTAFGQSEPYPSISVDTVRGACDTTIAGNRVTRRYATDADILGLARAWTADQPFGEWLASAARVEGLCEEERARLAGLAERACDAEGVGQ